MGDQPTDDDLARARRDPAFRQELMAKNLDRLLAALNKMRRVKEPTPVHARQIREGVDLAVKLADRLQQRSGTPGPRAA
jgi:hypothetical protein